MGTFIEMKTVASLALGIAALATVTACSSSPAGSPSDLVQPEAGSPLADASTGHVDATAGASQDAAPSEQDAESADATGLDARGGDDAEAGDGTQLAVDAAGIPEVARCLLAPNVISVVATGGFGNPDGGLDGAAEEITGDAGTWFVPIHGPDEIQFGPADQHWGFLASVGVPDGGAADILRSGATYSSGPSGLESRAIVAAPGAICSVIEDGSFTIVDIGFQGTGDAPPLLRYLGTFDLTCGDAGRVVGCARFTQ